MKKYYISKRDGESGICKYSADFYDLVLQQKGYIFLDSSTPISTIISQVYLTDEIHVETGIFLNDESKILFNLLNEGYINVSITVHDPPLIRFPFFKFKNGLLNNLSKVYDVYINKFRYQKKYLKKIKSIYVLTHKGKDIMKLKYKLENVFFLPHIVNKALVKKSEANNLNFIYLGFIGRNKGLEYSLKLHQQLQKTFPEMMFYIVGKALGKQQSFYNELKETYKEQTCFTGYIDDQKLNELFTNSTFSLLPFNNYKFYTPFSGSILYALTMGTIVFTNKKNAIEEIVEEGKTGFFLSGNLSEDVVLVRQTIQDEILKNNIRSNAYETLINNYSTEAVSRHYRN